MTFVRSPLFEELRSRLKVESKKEDIVTLVAWMLTHFTDDGYLRSPQAPRRKTVMVEGVKYWLVRVPTESA